MFQQNRLNILYFSKEQISSLLPSKLSFPMQDKKHQNNVDKDMSVKHFSNIYNPSKKSDCANCLKNISDFTFILYEEKNFCVPCFSILRKWPGHYQVINKLEFPFFSEGWSAFQQLMLFQGLQKHGFGNWNEIADYIDTNKTRQDVQRHYSQIFLSSPNFIPDNSKILSRKLSFSKANKNVKTNGRQRQTLTSKRLQTINMEKKNPKPQNAEVVGYMPLRKDFQFEYDNEAELLLAEMEFSEEDTPEEKQMKFKILQIYNQRLTERNRKKDFVISRGILDLDKQLKIQKSRPKNEKQIYNMMKIFSRFHTAEEHEQLVQGLIRQKQLKQKIQEYRQLRDRGFTTREEVEAELQRKMQAKSKKKSGASDYHFLKAQYDQPRGNHRRANISKEDHSSLQKFQSPYFTHQQLQLCKSLKLSGVNYMLIKETLIRESLKTGHIERQIALQMFRVQKFILNSIITFLAERDEIACID